MTTKAIFNGLPRPAILLFLFLSVFAVTRAQVVTVVADAGKGISGPAGLVPDNSGHLYAADWGNSAVYKIDLANGSISTIVESTVDFYSPGGMAYDGTRYLYVALSSGRAIRRIDLTDNTFITIAGDGTQGNENGQGSAARFKYPWGLALDVAAGNLYVADQENHTIRKIDLSTNTVSTIAGLAGQQGSQNGQGSQARFDNPTGLALGANGQLYVSDANNNIIRKIDLNNSNTVTTIAGLAGETGNTDAAGTQARFNYPTGLALYGNDILFVGDNFNGRIRRINLSSNNAVATVTGDAGSLDNAGGDVAVDAAGNLYFSDFFMSEIRRIGSGAALPVTFGSINSYIKNKELYVSWQTLSESNNDHFDVQVSGDGEKFATVATIKSQAKEGNSDQSLNYQISLGVSAATGLMAAGLLSLFSLSACSKRKKWLAIGLLSGAISLTGYSCTKADTIDPISKKLYIRIAQVDKDGSTTYSKVFITNHD
ncbi:NHL repeat-containing protein [Niabella aquatica]